MKLSVRNMIVLASAIGIFLSSLAWAGGRRDDSDRKWYGQFSAGYQFPVGAVGDILDNSFTISGGAMYWPSDWPAGINVNLAYSNPDITGKAINDINNQISKDPANSGSIDGGDVSIWQLTVNGIWSLGKKTEGFYLTGGAGVYRLKARLTQVGLAYYPPICNPWWYWCTPPGIGPGSYVVASDTVTKYGLNGGVGYSFPPGYLSQWFIEAKYHYINTDRKETAYIPVEVGVRW